MERRRSVTKNRLYIEGLGNYLTRDTADAPDYAGFRHTLANPAAVFVLPARRKLIGAQQGVHGPRAEAFEIEGNELEAESLEDAGEFGNHRGI